MDVLSVYVDSSFSNYRTPAHVILNIKTQNNCSMILQLLILMLASLAPVFADDVALLHPEETNCTVRVHRESVFIKIRSSGTNDIMNIYANGTYVAYCDTAAALMKSDFQDCYHVFLTPRGTCDFIIYNYDGNIFSVNITSEARKLTEVSVQGVPITNCFRPSSVVLNLKEQQTNCTVRVHQDSVVFKIRSSDNGTIKIHANGTYVAYCHPKAELRQPDFKDNYHVSLTPKGSCVFIIYNYDGNIFSINITSETRNLTEVSVQGVPITNCFRPSSVVLNLKGEEKCHQQGIGTVCKVGGVPVWAVVLIVILSVVLLVAAVLALWCGCKRAGMDQSSSNHVKGRRNSGDTDMHDAKTLLKNGTERHDSNGAVKEETPGSLELGPFTNENRGGRQQDRNDTVKGKPRRNRQDSTKTYKGKPGAARQDEAINGKLGRGRQNINDALNDTPERGRQESNEAVKDKARRGRHDSNEVVSNKQRRGRQENNEAVKDKARRGRHDSNEVVSDKQRRGRQENNEAFIDKPGRGRQDSNETVKAKRGRERQNSDYAVKDKLGRGRQDSNDVVKDKPGRDVKESNDAIKGWQECNDAVDSEFCDTIGKGNRKIDRNATAKERHRKKIPQQSFRMRSRKTQRSFGPGEPSLRNRFKALMDPV